MSGDMPAAKRPTGFAPGEYPELTRAAVDAAIDAAFAAAGIAGWKASDIQIAQIWAQTTAGVIGDGRDMPWYLPEDLKFFKEMTWGYPVVMGRTSWEALEDPYRPLPGRENWVITRNAEYDAPGGHVVASIEDGVAAAAVWIVQQIMQQEAAGAPGSAESASAGESLEPIVWILGGGQVYAQCMPVADRLVITEIDMEAPARFQVYGPEVPEDAFTVRASEWAWSERGRAASAEVDGAEVASAEAASAEADGATESAAGGLRFRFCDWTRA